MKRWYYIGLVGVGILGGSYAYLHRQELGLGGSSGGTVDVGSSTDSGSSADSSAARPAHVSWKKIDRSPDGFKVDMPSDIKEIQVPAYNEHGGSEQVSMIFANPDAETTFSVSWADDPPVARVSSHAPDRTLDMARNDALQRTQTTLVNELRTSQGGFPAREFAARNVGGGVMNSRLIYAGTRLYMLTAAFPSAGARRDQDVVRFFTSFSIISAPGIPETMPQAANTRD